MSLFKQTRPEERRRPDSAPLGVFHVRNQKALCYLLIFPLIGLYGLGVGCYHIFGVLADKSLGWGLLIVVFLICGCLCGLAFLFTLFQVCRIARLLGRKFIVYSEGLGLQWFWVFRLIPWDQIATIRGYTWLGVNVRSKVQDPCKYWILVRGGPRFVLTHELVDGLSRLGQAIQTHSLPYLFDEAWQRLQSGESVQFGPLRIARTGIEADGRFRFGPLTVSQPGFEAGPQHLPWAEIEAVEFHLGGPCAIRRKGHAQPWFKGESYRIPNFQVFAACVRNLLAPESGLPDDSFREKFQVSPAKPKTDIQQPRDSESIGQTERIRERPDSN